MSLSSKAMHGVSRRVCLLVLLLMILLRALVSIPNGSPTLLTRVRTIGVSMSKVALESYLRHVDHNGTDMVWETAEHDRDLTDAEKEAVRAYVTLKQKQNKPKKARRRKQHGK